MHCHEFYFVTYAVSMLLNIVSCKKNLQNVHHTANTQSTFLSEANSKLTKNHKTCIFSGQDVQKALNEVAVNEYAPKSSMVLSVTNLADEIDEAKLEEKFCQHGVILVIKTQDYLISDSFF